MKSKSPQPFLIGIAVCLFIFNIGLLYLHQQDKNRLERAVQSINKLMDTEFLFEISKEVTATRFKYEQYKIGDAPIYIGSDNSSLLLVRSITEQPKLVLGLNQNMCRPCVEGVFADVKEFFPDFETNPNILCVADIEQRFKDNYFNKTVVSFRQKDDFPLYEIDTPYFFILDKDLCVKLLFITDKSSPELTKAYLKIIRERYPDI